MARSTTSFLRISTEVRDSLRTFCRKKGLVMGTAASEALREFIAKSGGNRLTKPIKTKRTKKAKVRKLARPARGRRQKKVAKHATPSTTA